MNYSYVIDSYAWIEYFRGSKSGVKSKPYIEGGNSVTPTIVVAELSRKFTNEVNVGRETLDGRRKALLYIGTTTTIFDLTKEVAELAGEVDVERKVLVKGWGLADSIILATTRMLKAKIVTGDTHFKDLKDEIISVW